MRELGRLLALAWVDLATSPCQAQVWKCMGNG